MRKYIKNKDGTITHEITFKAFLYTSYAIEKASKDLLSPLQSEPEDKENVDEDRVHMS